MSLPIVQSYTYITDDILHVFLTTLIEQLADSYFIIEYYLSMEYFPYLVQLLEYCDYVLICNICGYVCINRTLDYDYEYYLYT